MKGSSICSVSSSLSPTNFYRNELQLIPISTDCLSVYVHKFTAFGLSVKHYFYEMKWNVLWVFQFIDSNNKLKPKLNEVMVN